MSTVKNILKLGAVFAVTAMLVACGSGPSEADVRKAFNATIAEQKALLDGGLGSDMQKMLGEMLPEMKFVALQGCESAKDGVYMCDVEMQITLLGQTETLVDAVPMQKNKAGDWELTH